MSRNGGSSSGDIGASGMADEAVARLQSQLDGARSTLTTERLRVLVREVFLVVLQLVLGPLVVWRLRAKRILPALVAPRRGTCLDLAAFNPGLAWRTLASQALPQSSLWHSNWGGECATSC